METAIIFDETKLKELVVYLAAKSSSDPKFGKTKLNKLLFFSDFTAYARLGAPITGVPYVKKQFGPVPRDMKKTTDALVSENRIVCQDLTIGGYEGVRPIAIRDPDLGVFSANQIAIVDEMISRYRSYSGTDISDASHGFIGWGLASLGAEIPYFTALIRDRPCPLSASNFDEAVRRAMALYPHFTLAVAAR